MELCTITEKHILLFPVVQTCFICYKMSSSLWFSVSKTINPNIEYTHQNVITGVTHKVYLKC